MTERSQHVVPAVLGANLSAQPHILEVFLVEDNIQTTMAHAAAMTALAAAKMANLLPSLRGMHCDALARMLILVTIIQILVLVAMVGMPLSHRGKNRLLLFEMREGMQSNSLVAVIARVVTRRAHASIAIRGELPKEIGLNALAVLPMTASTHIQLLVTTTKMHLCQLSMKTRCLPTVPNLP